MPSSHGHSHGGAPCTGHGHGAGGGSGGQRISISKCPLVILAALIIFFTYMQYYDQVAPEDLTSTLGTNTAVVRQAAVIVETHQQDQEAIEESDEDAVWRKKLTKEQFQVLRKKGTERPFSGDLYTNKLPGKYLCAACDNLIF